MWISTKAQYGLRALIEIGRYGQQNGQIVAVPLKDIAQRQSISQHYLEQIASNLRRSGFVKSVRGAYGGYKLARPADKITAYEVVIAMEGSIAPVDCVEENHICEQSNICGTLLLWSRVDKALKDVLMASTLEDLIKETVQTEHKSLVQLELS